MIMITIEEVSEYIPTIEFEPTKGHYYRCAVCGFDFNKKYVKCKICKHPRSNHCYKELKCLLCKCKRYQVYGV